MGNAVQSIKERLINVMKEEPWHGDSVSKILANVDPATVFNKVSPELHSAIELVCHMNTWTSFVTDRISEHPKQTVEEVEANDWVIGDANIQQWDKSLNDFYTLYDQLLESVDQLKDDRLDEMVKDKDYTIRYMLEGLVHHFIYHSAQLSYLNKFFATEDDNRVFQVL
jgi:DinB superfamily